MKRIVLLGGKGTSPTQDGKINKAGEEMLNTSLLPPYVKGIEAANLKEFTPCEGISLEDAFDAKIEKFIHRLVDGKINGLYSIVVHDVEKRLIEAVLMKTKGNQTRASKILGINRNTLRKKMSMFEISHQEIKERVAEG